MEKINEIIKYARDNNCSDIHLTANLNPVFRKNGSIFVSNLEYTKDQIKHAILSMLNTNDREKINLHEDADFCYETPEKLRQRVNVYHQKGNLCAAIRILNDEIPTMDSLNLPKTIENLCKMSSGLILVTGPTGSGKSTTLASMIDYINENYNKHILTLEDPIEYIHEHKKSIIHQREIDNDIASFNDGLRSALREDPDVILVGEMRDFETISAVVTAAETGHLVLSTLHTTGAANTIDRIIDVFETGAKEQIRTQLASVLKGVITQQLVNKADGSGRCVALEILVATDAVLNLIRENKTHQISSIMQTSTKDGMCSMDMNLAKLANDGQINHDEAISKAINKKDFFRY